MKTTKNTTRAKKAEKPPEKKKDVPVEKLDKNQGAYGAALSAKVKMLEFNFGEQLRKADVSEKRIKDLERHADLTKDRINSLETSYKWKKDEYSMLKSLYDILQRPVFETMKIVDTIREYLMAQHGYDPENPSKPYDKAASTGAAGAGGYTKEGPKPRFDGNPYTPIGKK